MGLGRGRGHIGVIAAAPFAPLFSGELGGGGVAVLGDDVAAHVQQRLGGLAFQGHVEQVLVTLTYTLASGLTDFTPMAKALMPPVTSELDLSIAAT